MGRPTQRTAYFVANATAKATSSKHRFSPKAASGSLLIQSIIVQMQLLPGLRAQLMNPASKQAIYQVREAVTCCVWRCAQAARLVRSAIASTRYIERTTGSSISSPSTTTSPVVSCSNAAQTFCAFSIAFASGVKAA